MTNRFAQDPTGSTVPTDRVGVSGCDGTWPRGARCAPLREAMRKIGVSLFLLATACSLTAQQRVRLDTTVSIRRDTRVVDEPAIASHFHQLAAEALEGSIPDAPKHYVSLLNIGEDALIARIHLIRAARESIDSQVFIWVDDAVGHLMFD